MHVDRRLTLLVLAALLVGLTACSSKPEDPFENPDPPFNADKYPGMVENMSAIGMKSNTIDLMKDGQVYGYLEFKDRLPITGGLFLGGKKHLLRMQLVEEGDTWRDFQRTAIKNGRLYIELAPDGRVFTLSNPNHVNLTADLEEGITHPPQS